MLRVAMPPILNKPLCFSLDDEEGHVVGLGDADEEVADFVDDNPGKVGRGIPGIISHQVFQTFIAEHLMLLVEGFGDAVGVHNDHIAGSKLFGFQIIFDARFDGERAVANA